MTPSLVPDVTTILPKPATEFPYGWRYVRQPNAQGAEDLIMVPLTLEDALHPQEDDVIPENMQHEGERRYLTSVLETRDLHPPIALVTSDLIIDWGVPGVRNHSPDVAVFAGLRRRPDLRTGTLPLRALGGRCLLAVELVSPSTRNNDVVHKFAEYHQVGVPFYLLIDQQDEEGPRQIHAYQYEVDAYREIQPDSQGRILLPIANMRVGLVDSRLACYDAMTGAELGNYTEVVRKLEDAEKEIAQKQEEIAQKQEEIARKEKALKAAHEQTQEAERQLLEQKRATEEAERLARLAQDRIRELEETLRRTLPSPGPDHEAK